jgi:hypothetical protein
MGTVINLQTSDDGVWFPFFYSRIDPDTMDVEYDDPIEDGPRMKIRNPVDFFQDRSQNRKTKSEFILNKKSRSMEKVVSEIELSAKEKKAENEEFADYVIMDVEGFKLNGKTMGNTKADKIAAMKLPLVNMFVNKCVQDLQSQSAVEEKADSKNSSTGLTSAKTKVGPG